MKLRGVFVTGTGTGVGKTVVSAGLLRSLREFGVSALPVKPVQTGCDEKDCSLSAPDLEFCLGTAGLQPETRLLKLMCPFRYATPCSPHLAGRLHGRRMNIESVIGKMIKLRRSCDFMIAEGAGGIMVPINENETMLDLMTELEWPVILVARGDLGTINHTLLSLDVLRRAGLCTVAVVVNHLADDTSVAASHNAESIEEFGKVPLVVEIPYLRNSGGYLNNLIFREIMMVLGRSVI